jgi:hypothetical protein
MRKIYYRYKDRLEWWVIKHETDIVIVTVGILLTLATYTMAKGV